MDKNIKLKDLFPLADSLRPERIEDFIGQGHLVSEGKVIRSLIDSGNPGSMVFWGPPGTGKTTLSRIIVKTLSLPAIEFSATISGIAEIRKVMKKAGDIKMTTGKPLVLFVDEIHHFNKSVQDAFLPYVEKGEIILLGTTTENPAYKMNRALLSRLQIMEFFPLNDDNLREILTRGVGFIKDRTGLSPDLSREIRNIIVNLSGGDGRKLLNILELASGVASEGRKIDRSVIADIVSKKISAYDRSGDERYALISAFHKAVRNSDLDSSLFWLYRMMEDGEDLLFIIRRMIRICAEDIGFADPEALSLILRVKDAFEYLGSPEGEIFLEMGTVYLASAPKSNSLYKTEKRMKKIVEKYGNVKVPVHIVNPSNFLNRRKGAGKGYVYAHDFKEKTTLMNTMAKEVIEKDFFEPNTMGFEKKIMERIEYWKKIKEKLKKDNG